MIKTKLGLSVGLYCCLTYLCSLFVGPLAVLFLAGYVFLKEENIWLKKNVLKALILTLSFSVVSTLFGIIPSINDLIYTISYSVGTEFISFVGRVLMEVIFVVEKILTLILAYKALKQGTIKIRLIDNIIDKHLSVSDDQD